MRLHSAFAISLLVGTVVAGCTEGTVDKGGGSGGVLTLELASPDSPGSPGSRQIGYFAEQVESLSDGRIRVEVAWDIGRGDRSWDQVTAQQVIEGESELGLVPARSWDVLGVTTLQALQAPFVITSDAALDAVVSDPVADEMLAGLDELGVTGLGLFPEGLRHPAGYAGPLLELDDFAGLGIRTPRSDLSWEVIEALGAEPLDLSTDDEAALYDSGDLGGAETSAAYLPSLHRRGVMTANITPYAKADVLVANSAVLAALTDDQRSVLNQASEATLEHTVQTRNSDAEDLAAVCEQGLDIVFATDEERAAMTAATRPVRDRLAADATSGPLFERITEIAETAAPPEAVASCEAAVAAAAPSHDVAAYDGLWRYEVTYEDGVDAGLPEAKARSELGVQTVRLDGGTFRWDWRSANGEKSCQGRYEITDGVILFREEPRCGGLWEARPERTGDEIRWSDVHSRATGDPVDQKLREILHSVPWRQIDEIPLAEALPEGVYRWEVDEDALVAAGVDGGTAYHNSGLMTMTVDGGRWLHHTESPSDEPDCGGIYEIRGSHIAFSTDEGIQCGSAAGDLVFSGRWSATENGIRFTDIQPAGAFGEIFWGTPWRRIS
jgi:TRAP-type C4-dicarboxylate transport system substrate-binding protein